MSGLPQSGIGQLQRLPAGDNTDPRHQGLQVPRRAARREPGRERRRQERLLDRRSRSRWRAAPPSTSTSSTTSARRSATRCCRRATRCCWRPTINILRHPAWGRAQETYGEDPFLLGPPRHRVHRRRAAATSPPAPSTTRPTTSRTAAQSANAKMDEQTLREIYARHFGMVDPRRRRLLRDGLVQPGQRHEGDAEQAPADRYPARRLRVQGLRAQRLVGDADRRQPGDDAERRSRPTAVEAVHAGLDMELPWRYNYSTLTTPSPTGRSRSSGPDRVGGAHPRAEVPLQRRRASGRSAARRRSPSTTRPPRDHEERSRATRRSA